MKEKIHINATCMCITYHIAFVCGLTNPSEREMINDNQCAQYHPAKPPAPEVGPSKAALQKGLTQSPTAATVE